MAEQEITNLVQENIEALNANDTNRFEATLTDDITYQALGIHAHIQGRDEVIKMIQEWKQAFPDVKVTIQSIIASGNQAAAEITWGGTHLGEMVAPGGTIAASGKRFQIQASLVFTSEGGKMKEMHHYYDLMTLLQQIGAMPQR